MSDPNPKAQIPLRLVAACLVFPRYQTCVPGLGDRSRLVKHSATSEDEFQSELHIPVRGGGSRNYSECRCIERLAGKAEVGVIQSVE